MAVRRKFDLTAGALYLTIADGDVTLTVQIDGGTAVDLDAAGTVLGIEVLTPGRPWPLLDILRWYVSISGEDAEELLTGYPFPLPVAKVVVP